jgi:hypothetical protein
MILIKDMEMPKSCNECFYVKDCQTFELNTLNMLASKDSSIQISTLLINTFARLPECPLIEVEPYGIDGLLYKEK